MGMNINLTWILLFSLIGIALFLLHNLGGMKIFSKHDNDLTSKFLEKFPLVNPEFYHKSAKMRDVENNQEIHELKKELEELKDDINKKLEFMLKEIEKRG